jgi:hypothetical protein
LPGQTGKAQQTGKGADVKGVFAAALLSIALCSCAVHSDANIHRNLIGLTVVGNDQQAIVSHVRNETDGRRLADKHCKQFGKSARFNRMEATRAIFDCQSLEISPTASRLP